MGRKSGADQEKLRKIRRVLKSNPKGIWIRELARKAKLDKSTVSIYLNKYLSEDIEDVYPVRGKLIRIVRLRR